jgi:hypothetical protein
MERLTGLLLVESAGFWQKLNEVVSCVLEIKLHRKPGGRKG